MKKAITLFLTLVLALSVAALPAAASDEDPRTEVTSYDLYLEAIKEYDQRYQEVLFEAGAVHIYELNRAYYFSHYKMTKVAFLDYSRVNTYLRFCKAMKACGGKVQTAQELRDYNWREQAYHDTYTDRWFEIYDYDFDRWYADYQNGVDPGPDPDKTEITQEGDSVTFSNPDFGYTLTLSPVLSYEDIDLMNYGIDAEVPTRIYHMPYDGSATVTVRNIDSVDHLFGYDSALYGYLPDYSRYSGFAGGGAVFKIQQCAPGSEVSWSFNWEPAFYFGQSLNEEWMAGFYYFMFPSMEEAESEGWYNYLCYYDMYITFDGGRISYTDQTIDGESFDDYLARERANVTVGGFSDVHKNDYYADAVQWAVNHNPQVTNGVSATEFGPDSTVNRAQAVTFLWRAAGEPEPSTTTSPFTDVTDTGAWYYKAVLWAAEKGITNGVSATEFGLNGTLAYDQMLTFMARAAGADASGADWSEKALAWARENGLTSGLTFTAKGNCPRADVVYCLWKQMA